ncbi:thioredoxin domain-containing protein 11 isoform X2 [Nilaparvata lugens]|nr:thioredoxin domain-containing protein 11 isoform X2 [Nilaparvata lugens]
MIKFIENLLHPISRIDTVKEFYQLQIRHDTVLVGFIEFSNMRGGLEYKALYDSALKLAEKGTNQDVGVAVATNSIIATEVTITKMPSLYLISWDDCKEYTGTWKSEAIVQWVAQNIERAAMWLSPPGSKSLSFKRFVEEGSVLILFTPDNPLLDHNHHYDMIREIGFDYYNCDNDSAVIDFRNYFSAHRLVMIRKEEQLLETCVKRMKSLAIEAENSEDMTSIPFQIVENVWINSSSSAQKNRRKHRPTTLSETTEGWLSFITSTCSVDENMPKSAKKWSSHRDHRSATSLMAWSLQEKCSRYMRAVSLGLPPRIRKSAAYDKVPHDQLMGLACKTNRSLSLLAMDANIYQHFADGLGIDLNTYPHRTAALIFNGQQETVHLLSKPLTKSNLANFIIDFTAGKAERHLRSEPRRSQPPNRYKPGLSSDANNRTRSIALLELTSKTFQAVALNETQNVVVLYHSPYCGFCASISHVYLTVANLLRRLPTVQFCRIDGESNDLPWQYTVHHYPSILLFPAAPRKADSRVFPQRAPITVDALAQFVLANLPLHLRLQGAIDLCQRWGSKHYVKKQEDCLLGIRQTCLNLISKTLSTYRSVYRSNLSRKYKQKTCKWLLKRLRYLKEIHLYLGTSNLSKARNLVKEFQTIYVDNPDIQKSADDKTNLHQSTFLRDEL